MVHGWLVWQRVSSEILLDTFGEGINERLNNLIAGRASGGILVWAAWRERMREKGGGGEERGGEGGGEGGGEEEG